MSQESFHTSPSISFDGQLMHPQPAHSESSRPTDQEPGSTPRSIRNKGRSVLHSHRNPTSFFMAVAEETEDDLRLAMPSQQELSKSRSTRLPP